ncbi:hypothetical protein Z043_125253, partial [Scleropages formosus]
MAEGVPASDGNDDIKKGLQYVRSERADLIQYVVEVMPISDELLQNKMIHEETYSKLRSLGTHQDKMRELYIALDSGGDKVKYAFYTSLKNYPHLVMDPVSTVETTVRFQDDNGSVVLEVPPRWQTSAKGDPWAARNPIEGAIVLGDPLVNEPEQKLGLARPAVHGSTRTEYAIVIR